MKPIWLSVVPVLLFANAEAAPPPCNAGFTEAEIAGTAGHAYVCESQPYRCPAFGDVASNGVSTKTIRTEAGPSYVFTCIYPFGAEQNKPPQQYCGDGFPRLTQHFATADTNLSVPSGFDCQTLPLACRSGKGSPVTLTPLRANGAFWYLYGCELR